jgi:integrase/recombinase XerD
MNEPSRVRVTGPLAPFAKGFVDVLAEAGYRPRSAAVQLRLLARFSGWLAAEGLDLRSWVSRGWIGFAANTPPSFRV